MSTRVDHACDRDPESTNPFALCCDAGAVTCRHVPGCGQAPDRYVPLMVEAGRAFPGRVIATAVQCGRHLAVTFEDGTSACTCGAVWSFGAWTRAELRRYALAQHVEVWDPM